MALSYYSFTALLLSDSSGGENVATNTALTVDIFGGGAATIYNDFAGSTAITQPGAVTDAYGVFSFYAAAGKYTITIGARTKDVTLEAVLVSATLTTTQLTAGQQIITTGVDAFTGVFYISDDASNGLSKRLTIATDYSVQNTSQITLVNSVTANTYFTEQGSALIREPTPGLIGAGPVELIAHRGFADTGFENTLLSISNSIMYGADSFECDAAVSSDGVWYLFHDIALDALTDGTGDFVDASSATIDGLKYDKGVGTAFDPIGITKLEDVLNFTRQSGVRAYIEMKLFRNDEADVDAFMTLVDSYGLLKSVSISSSSTARLSRARLYSSTVSLGFLSGSSDHAANVVTALAAGTDRVNNNKDNFTSKADVDIYYDAGLDVAVWTIERAEDAIEMINYGIRKIIADRSVI